MKYRLVVRPEAEADIDEVYRWYEGQRPGLGRRFLSEVKTALESLREYLTSYQIIHEQVRRILLNRFPYALFYRIVDNSTLVFACLHVRRDPQRWQERV
jgi:plasmid stabilization system protein ParE